MRNIFTKKVAQGHEVYEILYEERGPCQDPKMREGVIHNIMIRMDYASAEICNDYLEEQIKRFRETEQMHKENLIVLKIWEVKYPVVWLALVEKDFKHLLLEDFD